jgi:hypothetical protein
MPTVTASQKVHLSREARNCASSFVIAAYFYVRLIPQDSRALSRLWRESFLLCRLLWRLLTKSSTVPHAWIRRNQFLSERSDSKARGQGDTPFLTGGDKPVSTLIRPTCSPFNPPFRRRKGSTPGRRHIDQLRVASAMARPLAAAFSIIAPKRAAAWKPSGFPASKPAPTSSTARRLPCRARV